MKEKLPKKAKVPKVKKPGKIERLDQLEAQLSALRAEVDRVSGLQNALVLKLKTMSTTGSTTGEQPQEQIKPSNVV